MNKGKTVISEGLNGEMFKTHYLYGFVGKVDEKETGEVFSLAFDDLYSTKEKAIDVLMKRGFSKEKNKDNKDIYVAEAPGNPGDILTLWIEEFHYTETISE